MRKLFLGLTYALGVRIGEELGVRFENRHANEGAAGGGTLDTRTKAEQAIL